MPHDMQDVKVGQDQIRLPAGLVLKPAVSAADLETDTELDPDGAEEFAAMVRVLRTEGARLVSPLYPFIA